MTVMLSKTLSCRTYPQGVEFCHVDDSPAKVTRICWDELAKIPQINEMLELCKVIANYEEEMEYGMLDVLDFFDEIAATANDALDRWKT